MTNEVYQRRYIVDVVWYDNDVVHRSDVDRLLPAEAIAEELYHALWGLYGEVFMVEATFVEENVRTV